MSGLKVMLVNNTKTDIRHISDFFFDFEKTGELHEDVADLFKAYIVEENGYRKIIVDFLED